MQIALMQSNSTENIIIRQTSENENSCFDTNSNAVLPSPWQRCSSCFSFQNYNIIIELKVKCSKHFFCIYFHFNEVFVVMKAEWNFEKLSKKWIWNILKTTWLKIFKFHLSFAGNPKYQVQYIIFTSVEKLWRNFLKSSTVEIVFINYLHKYYPFFYQKSSISLLKH